MIGKAITTNKYKIDQRHGSRDWRGYYIDSRRYTVGVYFADLHFIQIDCQLRTKKTNCKFGDIDGEWCNYLDLESGDVLIIIDSSVEKKIELYTKLELISSKMFLIHLGDEAGSSDLSMIYNKFNFVWRTFCLNKYFNNKNKIWKNHHGSVG